MPHLYELTDQFKGLQSLIDSGEMSADDLADTIEGLSGDLVAKGCDVLLFMANLAGDIAAFEAEIKRMTARKKTLQNNHNWLKEYLRSNMIECDITKIESPVFTAALRKAGQMVEVYSEKDLPVSYQTMVPASWKINKAQILKDLKADIEIPGARLIDAKQGIVIT
ncbi:MAG: siphovirus Gp157 family protein [Bacteroidales bacterium]|nr:siphovirus Gp157 family protein [Candidatus Latescibacterota bacterium]